MEVVESMLERGLFGPDTTDVHPFSSLFYDFSAEAEARPWHRSLSGCQAGSRCADKGLARRRGDECWWIEDGQ